MDTHRPTWTSRVWLYVATILAVVFGAVSLLGIDTAEGAWAAVLIAVGIAVLTIVVAARYTRRQRRQYEVELADWAADRAAQAERLRIAADLHDLVSHGLGAITVRAAVAQEIGGRQGDTERAEALRDIEQVSRETTAELRRMLGVLREPGDVPMEPAAQLDVVPYIVAAAETMGLRVTMEPLEPTTGEVAPGTQIIACAVIREALANAARHAGPTRVHVTVRHDRQWLYVDVSDAGPVDRWRPRPGAGHGLDALRDRVVAARGELTAGPEGRGFRVIARLPDTGPR